MTDSVRVNVRRLVLLREPPQRVWTALRDQLPAVAEFMSGIDEVRALERSSDGDGTLRTVHEWRAAAAVSAALARHVDAGALSWIERARWDDDALVSRWTVESRILGAGLVGSGTTRLETAMGGRGSRLAFEVSTSLGDGALGPLGRGRWKDGLEDAAAALLAKTLQDLGAAVEQFLKANAS